MTGCNLLDPGNIAGLAPLSPQQQWSDDMADAYTARDNRKVPI